MNLQPAEKQQLTGDLQVHSVFRTIQGEGPFTGHRAIFIRLAGCNLQCPFCDTDYTSCRSATLIPDLLTLVRTMAPFHEHLVVITGGEPFRQNLLPLVTGLLAYGYKVQIETNGTLYQELPYDKITVVCSPKTGSINKHLAPHISALKYVAGVNDIATDDGLPVQALGHPAKPRLARPPVNFSGTIYLQPIDESAKANPYHQEAVVKSVLKYGHTLCLQTHKILNLE